MEKVQFDFRENSRILSKIVDAYKENKDKPGASDIYIKVSKDIIDKEIDIFIKFHKMLISYDEFIFDIKQNLLN